MIKFSARHNGSRHAFTTGPDMDSNGRLVGLRTSSGRTLKTAKTIDAENTYSPAYSYALAA